MNAVALQKASEKDIIGSSYRGSINTTYDELVEVFGEPHRGKSPDNKVQAKWTFLIDGAVLMTIYDYKAGKPVKKVTDWHIGGKKGVNIISWFLATKGFKMED